MTFPEDTDRKGYDGADRRSWQGEADVLHRKLESIEEMARNTQSLAQSTQGLAQLTHDTIVSHVAEERETKAAIDELILLWRGSKLMVSGFKFIIPIVAAMFGAAIWLKDYFKQ